MKLGIGSYTYMWSIGFPGASPSRPLTALGLLERARQLGIRVVQCGPNLPLYALPAGELDAVLAASREWGFRVEGRPAGQGQLDVPWLLGALREAGARCNAILELWVPEQATLAETIALEERWAVESVAYLRNLVKDWA